MISFKLSTTSKYMPSLRSVWAALWGDGHRAQTPSHVHRNRMVIHRKSLTRVFEPWEPLQRFLSEKKSPLAARFSDTVWVAKLAYLCDIFSLLNELSLALQGKMTTVLKLADKVAAFKAKLALWGQRLNRGILDIFSSTSVYFRRDWAWFSQLVHDHLSLVLRNSSATFQPQKTNELVRNGSATHLLTNQANLACLCKKNINCGR